MFVAPSAPIASPTQSLLYLCNSSEVALVAVYADVVDSVPGQDLIDRIDGPCDGLFSAGKMAFLGVVENRHQRLKAVAEDGRVAVVELELSNEAKDGILFWRIFESDLRYNGALALM